MPSPVAAPCQELEDALRDQPVLKTPIWTLSAKSGACHPEGEDTVNWYVGYVEKSDGVHYFALEIRDKDFGRAFSERMSKAREILTALAVLR